MCLPNYICQKRPFSLSSSSIYPKSPICMAKSPVFLLLINLTLKDLFRSTSTAKCPSALTRCACQLGVCLLTPDARMSNRGPLEKRYLHLVSDTSLITDIWWSLLYYVKSWSGTGMLFDIACLLGWLVREVKVTKKKIQFIFLPLMTLVNESPKEFWFGVLEDLPLDLCFWPDLEL